MKPLILHIVTDITEMFSFLLFTDFFLFFHSGTSITYDRGVKRKAEGEC